MTRRHVDTKETAALVRKAIGEAFPGVKFQVRISRYSMGSSVSVRWTNGPTVKAVEAVANVFSGDYYDGMSDYHGSVYHTLDGEPVHFCGSISCSREFTKTVRDSFEAAWLALDENERTLLLQRLDYRADDFALRDDNYHQVIYGWDLYGQPVQPSPTAARVELAGDDGYRGSMAAWRAERDKRVSAE